MSPRKSPSTAAGVPADRLFDDDVIDPMMARKRDFHEDLDRALRDEPPLPGVNNDLRPFGGTATELAGWYDAPDEDLEGGDLSWPGDAEALFAPLEPAVNPLRHVGRNDPCPCGSGKKYKKCCLA